jgi:hypothetical protein
MNYFANDSWKNLLKMLIRFSRRLKENKLLIRLIYKHLCEVLVLLIGNNIFMFWSTLKCDKTFNIV